MIEVIERARRYVSKCPPAISGQRGHNKTFHVACVLVNGFALGEAESMQLLHDWNASCQPPWSEHELLHKVNAARHAQHAKPKGHLLGSGQAQLVDSRRESSCGRTNRRTSRTVTPVARKPAFKPNTLRRIADKTRDVPDIVRFVSERSPVRVETQDSASVLRRLYRRGSGEKVLIFTKYKSQGQGLWLADFSDQIQQVNIPEGDDGVWFLPQPVTGDFYPNPRQGGKKSQRSQEAVTAWRFALLESDDADPDDWLRCLVQVPLKIVSICESGGRSVHALVRLNAASKEDWDAKITQIKPILIALGADPGALSAVRLTRLPQAMRGDRVQRLLYLNPDANGTPIQFLPTQSKLYHTAWENQGKEVCV
jgi:hypothetical protein